MVESVYWGSPSRKTMVPRTGNAQWQFTFVIHTRRAPVGKGGMLWGFRLSVTRGVHRYLEAQKMSSVGVCYVVWVYNAAASPSGSANESYVLWGKGNAAQSYPGFSLNLAESSGGLLRSTAVSPAWGTCSSSAVLRCTHFDSLRKGQGDIVSFWLFLSPSFSFTAPDSLETIRTTIHQPTCKLIHTVCPYCMVLPIDTVDMMILLRVSSLTENALWCQMATDLGLDL